MERELLHEHRADLILPVWHIDISTRGTCYWFQFISDKTVKVLRHQTNNRSKRTCIILVAAKDREPSTSSTKNNTLVKEDEERGEREKKKHSTELICDRYEDADRRSLKVICPGAILSFCSHQWCTRVCHALVLGSACQRMSLISWHYIQYVKNL